MSDFQIILVVAVPVGGPEISLYQGRCTLELNVCVDAGGRLASALQAIVTPHCTLLLGGKEIWSGRLGRDSGEWVVQSAMGDDEPLRRLRATTLRPGDHLTLDFPHAGDIEFRVVQVSHAVNG